MSNWHVVMYCLLFLPAGVLSNTHAQDHKENTPFKSYQQVDIDNPSEAFQQIIHHVEQVKTFRAEFTEVRHIQALTRPLKNHGYILFSRNRGLLRRIEKPYKAYQLIAENGLVAEQTEGETRRKQLKPGTPPRAFLNSIFHMFSGEFQKFAEDYRLYLKTKRTTRNDKEDLHWHFGLKPVDKKLQSFLTHIILHGSGTRLKSVRVVQGNGDRTVTTYRNHTTLNKLPQKYIRLFQSLKRSSSK